jgi:Learning-associated protein
MTARSKKQQRRNKKIKREKNKVRELNMLKRTVYGKNAKEMMETCEELVDPKTIEELKKVSE